MIETENIQEINAFLQQVNHLLRISKKRLETNKKC